MSQQLQNIIDRLGRPREHQPSQRLAELRDAVNHVIAGLDAAASAWPTKPPAPGWSTSGSRKPCCCRSAWRTTWPAIGRHHAVLRQGADQVRQLHAEDFAKGGFRVVPPAVARRGSFIAKNVVLMPSYVNIGAYVDEGAMVDTWATVGSCAQIGKNVHLSGGVGIGGVLEPMQANPTIIEDNCFIGARSEIVEGVIVEENSVISMGVYIGQSTKIYDRATGEVTYGRVPAGSVVVSGSCLRTTASTRCTAP
jgi:2,3,4,5-tetrahydropyridine-2-carboxylate N-succinyltransferase